MYQYVWSGFTVAEIGAELDHLPVGIKPLAVPPHDRPDREGVPEIMDPRAAPMPAEALRLAQTEILADDREVVTCATVSRTLAIFDYEERARSGPSNLVRSAR